MSLAIYAGALFICVFIFISALRLAREVALERELIDTFVPTGLRDPAPRNLHINEEWYQVLYGFDLPQLSLDSRKLHYFLSMSMSKDEASVDKAVGSHNREWVSQNDDVYKLDDFRKGGLQ